ncbi:MULTISPECIES: MmgE/PrpD family protein [unclassified Mesorhizobium]|uniref:MmgE/PrpD family protein n=1 Tax=unclassified Mesorhizobium TaxID=325217 RepID=UPI00112D6B47|nr:MULTISPECIES: MmgE/PrpD family protein [unclassified Mesorhizobium]TPL02159.1 MmgE/PrpD family protein [Mesorhizobium sp. B2-4-16]TPL57399.1 MmgE/PrpD family protein [Mesorhizobium sp. B2-4-3]
MKQSATKTVATYTADSRRPPQEVVKQAKLHIVDTLACIYAGTGTDAVRILAVTNSWAGTPTDIPVPGWGYAKTLDGAAELLGTAAHAHDFDDTSFKTILHPSASIVASLLATAIALSGNHAKEPTGLDFIHSYVKGMEVACKVGEILGDDLTDQPFHTISTLGLLGAAVACASLRGLDAGKSEVALAIACSHAGGILNNCGTMVKPLHCGLSARGAYMAAALAENRFTAITDALEGSYGFFNAVTGGRRSDIELPSIDMRGTDLPPLTGEHFEIVNPGIEVKRYPCCQVAHTGIDGMRKLREREGFDIGKVEKIVCYVSSEKRISYLHCPDAKTPTEARFSMNFAVATAALYGDVTLDHFNKDLLASKDFRQLMALVEMRLQDKSEEDAVDIEVIFKDGRRMSERGTYKPVTWDDIVSKFNSCMGHACQPDDPKPILAVLEKLDVQKDISGIFLRGIDLHVNPGRWLP